MISVQSLFLFVVVMPLLCGQLMPQQRYQGKTASEWGRLISQSAIKYRPNLVLPCFEDTPRPKSGLDALKKHLGFSYVSVWACEPLRDGEIAAVPLLVELLDHNDPVVRMYAAETLGAYGVTVIDALPKIRRLSQDNEFGGFGFTVGEAAQSAVNRIEQSAKKIGR